MRESVDEVVEQILAESGIEADTPLLPETISKFIRSAYARGYTDALAAQSPDLGEASDFATAAALRLPVI